MLYCLLYVVKCFWCMCMYSYNLWCMYVIMLLYLCMYTFYTILARVGRLPEYNNQSINQTSINRNNYACLQALVNNVFTWKSSCVIANNT